MFSEDSEEFGYAGAYEGEVSGGGAVGVMALIFGLTLLAIIVVMVLAFTGTLPAGWVSMAMPASEKYWMSKNLTCTHTAADGFVCEAADPAIDNPSTNASNGGNERLSAVWKKERLSSDSGYLMNSSYSGLNGSRARGLERSCGGRQY